MRNLFLLAAAFAMLALAAGAKAEMPKNADKTQRLAKGVFDYQKNTKSNFELVTTNYGITGLDMSNVSGGGFWPRGSQNQYIFGSGFWFGAMRQALDNSGYKKLVEVSYNPNSGKSWFVPGRIEDGDTVRKDLKDKYRLYYSTDFYNASGLPVDPSDGPNWPLWVNDTTGRYQYGTFRHTYVLDVSQRNTGSYPYGPMFVSDEDIVSTFKDTDTRYIEGSPQFRSYPLRLQGESRIYSWGSNELKDIVLQSYLITNMSDDTLMNCWFAGVYDVDIAYAPNAAKGAGNDRTTFFSNDSTLELAVAWSEGNMGEFGKGFGYLGIAMLETPAVDARGFIRNDKLIFEPQEQLGLATYKNWDIQEDVQEVEARYNLISTGIRDSDKGAGDKRMLIATGPFNMKPGDVARVVFSYTFALPAKGGDADGTLEDMGGLKGITGDVKGDKSQSNSPSLIDEVKYIKDKYYSTILLSTSEDSGPVDFSIQQIYPNPVEDRFSVRYSLEKTTRIRLSLVDILGQEVLILYEGVQDAGSHSPVFTPDMSGITSGLYFVRLQSGSQVQTRQVAVVK
jgi:hypothetical protein